MEEAGKRVGWQLALLLAVTAGAAHLVAEAAGATTWALLTKPLPVLLLLARVCLAGGSTLRWPVVAGLAASAIGDVVIQRPGGFLAGLGCFLVAHLAYISGFWRARPALDPARALPFLLFGSLMGYWIAPGTGGMAIPVGVYILAISVMMWRAAALAGAPRLDPRIGWWATAGAIAFAASDSLIAIHRFVAPQPWVDPPIMILYWLGQAGIAAAAVVAGERTGVSPTREGAR